MMILNQKINDNIYPKQFVLLCVITAITFKVAMLPQYLCQYAGRNAYLSMAYLMTVELLMFGIIYGIIKNGSLFELGIPKPVKGVLVGLIIVSCFFRGGIMGCETVGYVGATLFEETAWEYVLLALLPIAVYIANKGISILSKASQMCFWFLVVTILFMVMFGQIDGSLSNLLPFDFSSDVLIAGDKHLVWFSNYTPLLFASLVTTQKSEKASTILGSTFILLCPIVLMIAFIATFGSGASFVPNAFGKLAIYNRISMMLGTLDFPTVCTWIILATLKISILLYGIIRGLKFFFGDKWWVSLVVGVGMWCIILYGFQNQKTAYDIASSWARYIVVAIEFGVPMLCYVFMRIYDPKRKSASCKQNVAKESADLSNN